MVWIQLRHRSDAVSERIQTATYLTVEYVKVVFVYFIDMWRHCT